MKFGVVTFPGSNCDEDMVYVLETVMGQQVERLWHKDTSLKGVDFVVLPGGFSYGDYLRSGAIAKLSPIMGEIMNPAGKGGYVMGICNGFQILTESGLLQGALLHNNNSNNNSGNFDDSGIRRWRRFGFALNLAGFFFHKGWRFVHLHRHSANIGLAPTVNLGLLLRLR